MNDRSCREILAEATARLAVAGVESPRLDARVLLAHVLGVRSDELFGNVRLAPEQTGAFEACVARRAAREPVAYITGMKEFFSFEFEVGRGALVPRPQSETLIEEAMRAFPDRDASLDVLDLGTGSGCLLMTFLKVYGHARGLGVDASADALAWARRNLKRHGLGGRCTLLEAGWNANGAFDVVFANPPYLTADEFARAAPEIRRYEPESALAAGEDGLAAYRALAPEIGRVLTPDGLAFVEIGADRAECVKRILEENGLELCRLAPDLAGIPRCVIARRCG